MSQDSNTNFNNLDPQKIVDTIERLSQRVSERFPDSGLTNVCSRLHDISENMKKRAEWIGRPVYWLRAITWLICFAILSMAIARFYYLAEPTAPLGSGGSRRRRRWLRDSAGGGPERHCFDSAAIFFFLTLETRYKRQRALKAIHELRTVAHIIDHASVDEGPASDHVQTGLFVNGIVSQAADDPVSIATLPGVLQRNAVIDGKIAAVYVQEFDDGVALTSATELETLTTGLSNKIWQTAPILETTSAVMIRHESKRCESLGSSSFGVRCRTCAADWSIFCLLFFLRRERLQS